MNDHGKVMQEKFVLHIQIDPHSGVPIYRQVMDQIKHYQTSGTIQAGKQLPSIRKLSQILAVNPTTISKAYNELKHEKVIEIKKGKGAFLMKPETVISEAKKRSVIERTARQMIMEARQIGASNDLVREIFEQTLYKASLDQ